MRTVFLAAAASLALAASAQAATTYYVGCEGDWTAEAPAAAFTDNSGCVAPTFKPPVEGATQWWLFGGPHADEIKEIQLELHSPLSDPLARQINLPVTIDIQVKAGDQTIFASGDAGVVGRTKASGTLPGAFAATFVLPELDVPATVDPKQISVAVTAHYNDDPFLWGAGASDAPSAITFLTEEDLPEPPEEEEEEL